MNTRLSFFVASFALVGCQATKQFDYSALVLPSPAPRVQGSIVHSRVSANPMVRNGQAYEMVRLELPAEIERVVVPTGTRVVWSENDECVVYLEKSLHWMGHPSAPTSIDTTRRAMGMGIRIRGKTLEIALFGAWSSFEGGSGVSAAVGLPAGLTVRESSALYFEDNEKVDGNRMYASAGWFNLPTVLDPDRGYLRLTNKSN